MENESRFSGTAADVWVSHGSHFRTPPALVLSDAPTADLDALTAQRCPAALPFAGRYRLIDFALSNCINSGIGTVGVIAQYQPRSLHAHLAFGRPWGLDRREGGLCVLHPYQTHGGIDWYTGTADAVYQNLEFILHHHADQVLILPANEVYSMDLGVLVAQHRETKADLTVAAVVRKGKTVARHYTLVADREGGVRAWILPDSDRPGPLAAMGVLLFSTDALRRGLCEDARQPHSTRDLFRDLIPRMIQKGDKVMAFQHAGYWRSVRTVHDYWQAHMDLLSETPDLNLQDAAWPIRGPLEVRPPTRVTAGAKVSRSLLSEGCVVEGTVERSVLSPGVHVAPGAVVRRAVVLHDTSIQECARIENAILDAEVIVGPRAQVGRVHRHAPTLGACDAEPLTVVGRGTYVPAGAAIQPGLLDDGRRPPPRRDALVEALDLPPHAVGGHRECEEELTNRGDPPERDHET